MALPLLFIGIAAVTGGSFGIKKTLNARQDMKTAKSINSVANQIIEKAKLELDVQRKNCGEALEKLGKEKIFISYHSINRFLNSFKLIKNINFHECDNFSELSKLHIDKTQFAELETISNFATSIVKGSIVGASGGALTAYGAYGAAHLFACASTGTAISTLSGAAATNATLAFFGGGSLAAGGLGMAGGTVVLGGFVAIPALIVLGLITSNNATKQLDKSFENKNEAIKFAAQTHKLALQSEFIRRTTYVFYDILARLDSHFLPLITKMENIIDREGDDYMHYSQESKNIISSCASIAITIKNIISTAILTDDGELTEESKSLIKNYKKY